MRSLFQAPFAARRIVVKRYLFGSLACAALACVLIGADTPSLPPAEKPAAIAVDLFDAMKSGDIEVKLILKDSTGGNVTIANKTDKPLTIKLPQAFAGVPALAQFGGGGMGMGGGGMMGGGMGGMGSGGMGGNQGFGGGMGGGMMGGMGGGGMGGMGGGGGGFFNVAPEKVGKLKVVGVCLEHGKKDPNTRVAYKLVPIETFTKDPQLIEVVKMVGSGEIRQHAGQAAAWHLANGLSWKQLANKIGVKHLNGATKPYFTRSDLDLALRVTQVASHRAESQESESPEAASPGEKIAAGSAESAE
jgi:hypothetical protein